MAGELPPCLRCGENDRFVVWEFGTDFGGIVTVYGCQRCGVCHIVTEGERPEDGHSNPPSGLY